MPCLCVPTLSHGLGCLAVVEPLNQLTGLVGLGLRDAPLTCSDLVRLSGLTNLTSLDVSSNLLTAPYAIQRALRSFVHLRHLDVSNCE